MLQSEVITSQQFTLVWTYAATRGHHPTRINTGIDICSHQRSSPHYTGDIQPPEVITPRYNQHWYGHLQPPEVITPLHWRYAATRGHHPATLEICSHQRSSPHYTGDMQPPEVITPLHWIYVAIRGHHPTTLEICSHQRSSTHYTGDM